MILHFITVKVSTKYFFPRHYFHILDSFLVRLLFIVFIFTTDLALALFLIIIMKPFIIRDANSIKGFICGRFGMAAMQSRNGKQPATRKPHIAGTVFNLIVLKLSSGKRDTNFKKTHFSIDRWQEWLRCPISHQGALRSIIGFRWSPIAWSRVPAGGVGEAPLPPPQLASPKGSVIPLWRVRLQTKCRINRYRVDRYGKPWQ